MPLFIALRRSLLGKLSSEIKSIQALPCCELKLARYQPAKPSDAFSCPRCFVDVKVSLMLLSLSDRAHFVSKKKRIAALDMVMAIGSC